MGRSVVRSIGRLLRLAIRPWTDRVRVWILVIRHKLVEPRDERRKDGYRDPVTVPRFTCVVAALLLSLGVCLPTRPAVGAVIIDSILVRVYDNAGVLSTDLSEALKHSYEILRRADV